MRITTANPLVLGSASPRRRDLLSTCGVPLVVRVADVDESLRSGETPDAYLERVVGAKLDAVRNDLRRVQSPPENMEGAMTASFGAQTRGILVADTIVVAPGEQVLGKPADRAQSIAMIELLSGAVHQVRTRFALGESAPGSPTLHAQTVVTSVVFRALEAAEALAYVATGEGRDKAGGYAIQGRASAFIQRIEGSYTNVVGLPLCEVVMALRKAGWLGAIGEA